jgi:hypothetical protein
MNVRVIKATATDPRPQCKRVTLRWFNDVSMGSTPSESGWVLGFDIGAKELLWGPPADRDYMRGKSINKNQKRALARRAAKHHAVKLVHGFKLTEDEVDGV